MESLVHSVFMYNQKVYEYTGETYTSLSAAELQYNYWLFCCTFCGGRLKKFRRVGFIHGLDLRTLRDGGEHLVLYVQDRLHVKTQ
jgi:hypothetical protein